MIAVIVDDAQLGAAHEFFQLFKTPWELYVEGRSYDVILCANGVADLPNARLTIVYGADKRPMDRSLGIEALTQRSPVEVGWEGSVFPVYAGTASFDCNAAAALTIKATGRAAGIAITRSDRTVARIGYDLFSEVEVLLAGCQPADRAAVPTLEIHIAIVRGLMIQAGLDFVEIPPVPHGHDLVACLTHDVDFFGIRPHPCDRTLLGFLYRATWGTFLDALKGRVRWQKLRLNVKAVLSLPAVYLGLAQDFWGSAELDRFFAAEKGLKSTYFFLPFPDVPGQLRTGQAPAWRAGKYDIRKIQDAVRRIVSAGCEVALHGIDAWRDSARGIQEAMAIRAVSGRSVSGVRMHWLYSDEQSPRALEQAGVSYDSTCGYNSAVGFRAGTAQVFRPLSVTRLRELPLLIQDTALFSGARMSLSEGQAFPQCERVIREVLTYGGVVTINWHTRSLSPERLWGDFYGRVLSLLRSRATWFATAEQVTGWFASRRAIAFRSEAANGQKTIVEGVTSTFGPKLKVVRRTAARRRHIEIPIERDGEVAGTYA